jgi:hypothetical protein
LRRSDGDRDVRRAAGGSAAPLPRAGRADLHARRLYAFKLGDTLREAPGGSFVFIPRGTPHTWQNIGAEPLRFFATIMLAAVAFEEFFKRYAQLPAEERGLEAFARVAAETKAFQVIGPPLAESDPL